MSRPPYDRCTAPGEFQGLRAEPVTELEQIEMVAQIRNICRDGYSNERNKIIDPHEQRAWWPSQGPRLHAWLFYAGQPFHNPDDEVLVDLVGFGMLRPLDDRRLTTVVGVLPEARGHDFGLSITRYLVHQATEPVWGSGGIHNPPAVRLHDPAHWHEVTSPDPSKVRAFEAWPLWITPAGGTVWNGQRWDTSTEAWVGP